MGKRSPNQTRPLRPRTAKTGRLADWHLLAAVLILACAWPSQASSEDVRTSEVLILNSYHLGFPFSDAEITGILGTFRRVDPGSQPFVEYMDCKHFPEAEHADKLAEFLQAKYRGRKISAVIAADNPALEFALDWRDDLFASVPIVFCGVNGYTDSMLAGHGRITGVAEVLDAATTVRIALDLHPRTREIVALHDYTVTGRLTRQELEAVIPQFADRVAFRFIDNLPMEEILRQLEQLPDDRLVLVLSFNTDKTGQVFPHQRSTELLSRHCPVPVYGLHELRIGHGIVGGSLLDGRLHGARAAEIALQVLGGKDPSSIPVDKTSTSRVMFDYRQLSRFGISLSALPPGSTVINRPESFYRKYRTLIIATAAVIAGLSIIICLLLLYIVTRKRAERHRLRLIAELESKNAELERFIYTTSHDLRSPLVTITGFLGMLEQDAAKGDIAAMKSDVKFISNATSRMDDLLHEIIEFSRIGRMVNPPTEVPLDELAKEAASLVAGRLAGREVKFEISPDMPVVRGDRKRLLEVFQNLIDNAIKFMGEQPEPRIEIGVRENETGQICYVRDNGIGLDPRYKEKIFSLFERLDPNTEGTGVGLAIVKRIVELHGGHIWVETAGPGKGCTMCFTLPPSLPSGDDRTA